MTYLVSLSVRDFNVALASDAPAPGGGAASAAAGLFFRTVFFCGSSKTITLTESMHSLSFPFLNRSQARL